MDNNYNNYNENQVSHEEGQESNVTYGSYSIDGGEANSRESTDAPVKKKRSGAAFFVLAAALLIGSSAAGGVYIGSRLAESKNAEIAASTAMIANTETAEAESTAENKVTLATTSENNTIIASASDVSGVVENVMPSIVSINNVYEYAVSDYFGRTYRQQGGGSGSGIIIGQNEDEVLIVTNNHVTASSGSTSNQKLTVTFNDEKTASATIKGADEGSDLAVLAVKISDIEADTLSKIKVATIGDSEKMKVGQMVIAIGNALGYGQSTTVGYVSALDREIADEDYTMKLIQTDAAINPGNSGGALLNAAGEVIGINSVKYADENIEGMGFAIPISTALPIINDLMNREEIAENEQSYLGIVGNDVTENYSQVYGMPVGIYISKVTENSPASKSGLKMGDIIVSLNGADIKTMSELQSKLAAIKSGTVVKLKIMQYENGSYVEKEVQVTLGSKAEAADFFNEGENSTSEQIPFGNSENESENNPFNFFFNQD